MTPLEKYYEYRRGYTFGVKTFYSDFHLGVDIICPLGTPIYAWEELEVTNAVFGTNGGNTIWVKCDGMLFRFLHLNKPGKKGKYKKGDVIGYTGNTGLSTAPHLHLDISKNGTLNLNDKKNFIDPDLYFKDNTMELTKDQKKDLAKLGFDFGDKLNESELDRLIKKALDLQNVPTPPPANCDAQNAEIVVLKAKVAELEPKADIGNRFAELVKMADDLTA